MFIQCCTVNTPRGQDDVFRGYLVSGAPKTFNPKHDEYIEMGEFSGIEDVQRDAPTAFVDKLASAYTKVSVSKSLFKP